MGLNVRLKNILPDVRFELSRIYKLIAFYFENAQMHMYMACRVVWSFQNFFCFQRWWIDVYLDWRLQEF